MLSRSLNLRRWIFNQWRLHRSGAGLSESNVQMPFPDVCGRHGRYGSSNGVAKYSTAAEPLSNVMSFRDIQQYYVMSSTKL
jgi:hypothetical protein